MMTSPSLRIINIAFTILLLIEDYYFASSNEVQKSFSKKRAYFLENFIIHFIAIKSCHLKIIIVVQIFLYNKKNILFSKEYK